MLEKKVTILLVLFITGSQSSTINHSFERNALQVALKEEVTISTAANIGNVSVGHKNDLKHVFTGIC